MMGSGKTTVGKAVAEIVDRPFYDTDEMVETGGRSIGEVWEQEGEETFRAMETEAVRAVPADVIAAAGGGAVLDPANREVMGNSGKVVWLKARSSTLAERLAGNRDRPLLTTAPANDVLTGLIAARSSVYEALATHQVETDGRTLDEVVGEVVRIWRA